MKIVCKQDLSYDEAYQVMNEIMNGETTPTQNAAFLAALSTKSAKAETTDEIAGRAVDKIKQQYKGLKIAGTYSPDMGFEKNAEVIIAAAMAMILSVFILSILL